MENSDVSPEKKKNPEILHLFQNISIVSLILSELNEFKLCLLKNHKEISLMSQLVILHGNKIKLRCQ